MPWIFSLLTQLLACWSLTFCFQDHSSNDALWAAVLVLLPIISVLSAGTVSVCDNTEEHQLTAYVYSEDIVEKDVQLAHMFQCCVI